MTGAAPTCPSCTQPGVMLEDGWQCRNEACPEFGQPLQPAEPETPEPPSPGGAGT